MSSKKTDAVKKTVVVVGGGFAGPPIARALSASLSPDKYELILVDARPYRVGLVAGLRVSITGDKTLKEQAITPFDRLFLNKPLGTFRQAKVLSVQQEKNASSGVLKLDDGNDVAYDVLIVATGSTWPGPVAFPLGRVEDFIAEESSKIKKAKKILLVGGGSVGLEAAGEIRDLYKDKEITIIHRAALPLSDLYPEHFRKYVVTSWKERKINFIFNDELETIPDSVSSEIKTRDGKVIDADLVLDTRGPKPDTSILKSLSSVEITDVGYVKVEPTLQVKNYKNIFAAGDIIDWKEAKMAAKTNAQFGVVANNVKVLLEGTGKVQEYKGLFEVIIITNGKDGGVGYLPILWGITIGNFLTKLLKSRGLLIPKMRAAVGY